MQKSLILFIILLIVITVAAAIEHKLEKENKTPLIAQTATLKN